MISDDEYLERVVAGIHSVTNANADVRWNEKINGRQFDVVVRFTLGTLRYLVLIEVKNKARKASAEDLDSFVTKAKDQLANKAVFVTAAGFQKGAIAVALRHGVDLFTISFDENDFDLPQYSHVFFLGNSDQLNVSPAISISAPELTLCIARVSLIFKNGKRFSIPVESSQMNYYLLRTELENGGNLYDLLQSQIFDPIGLSESRKELLKLPRPLKITPPDDYYYPAGKLARLELAIEGVMSRSLSGNVRIEPTALRHRVLYTNVITREVSRFRLEELPLGGRDVETGRFYFCVHPLRYYHCAKIDGDLITWDLIESFQAGQKHTGTFTQQKRYSFYYIPVSDEENTRRLMRRLEDYRSIRAGDTPQAPSVEPDGRPWQLSRWIESWRSAHR